MPMLPSSFQGDVVLEKRAGAFRLAPGRLDMPRSVHVWVNALALDVASRQHRFGNRE